MKELYYLLFPKSVTLLCHNCPVHCFCLVFVDCQSSVVFLVRPQYGINLFYNFFGASSSYAFCSTKIKNSLDYVFISTKIKTFWVIEEEILLFILHCRDCLYYCQCFSKLLGRINTMTVMMTMLLIELHSL